MSSAQKIIQAAAGNAAGEATYVEDVFSTYLYTGNGSTQTITNGIDLDAKGGLVWIKGRSSATYHVLYDTERGANKRLVSNNTNAEFSGTTELTAFNSNGFSLSSNSQLNDNNATYASWTFAKQEKFFDVVTYTGDGVQGRRVSHNLGCEPSMIITKCTSDAENWNVSVGSGAGIPDQIKLQLNNTGFSTSTYSYWGGVAGDATTEFGLYRGTATFSETNVSGREYVAYLFAHNNGDGIFGENGDQDIIKGGSYTGDGTSDGSQEINLGFEPQFVIIKDTTSSVQDWVIQDVMRGMAVDARGVYLKANTDQADLGAGYVQPTATGFKIRASSGQVNTSGNTYIYIAIRRGPMKTPESATEVFAPVTYTATGTNGRLISSGFPVDSAIIDPRDGYATPGGPNWFSRLTGNGRFLTTAATTAELDGSSNSNGIMGQDGITVSTTGTNVWSNVSGHDYVSWFLRRAPGFFDVVAYTGNGTVPQDVSHNLGVKPEIIIFKERDGNSNWAVYVESLTANNKMYLNLTNASGPAYGSFDATEPTASVFTVGADGTINGSGNIIAYLFATLPGVSKVGSYTGTGTGDGDTLNIDCGFSAGARFVLIKRTDTSGNWTVYDTERGINASADDKRLELNGTGAEDTNENTIEPLASGFTVRWDTDSSASNNPNVNGATYIFLAIA